MTRFQRFLFVGMISATFLAASISAAAKMLHPQPPSENPHPPVTPEDRKRVDFAQKTVELLLKPTMPKSLDSPYRESIGKVFTNKDLACLEKSSCLEKDPQFVNELLDIHRQLGEVVEMRHPHVIPGVKFIVHVYARFSKTKALWYHLDIIFTEDKAGNLVLLNFFPYLMSWYDAALPPGANVKKIIRAHIPLLLREFDELSPRESKQAL